MYPYSHQHLADELRKAAEEAIKDPRSHTFWRVRNILDQMEGTPEEQITRAVRACLHDASPANLSEVQNLMELRATRSIRQSLKG